MINVIMPLYKGVELVSTPLDSLLKQTIEKDAFIVTMVQDFDGLDYTDIIDFYKEKGLKINFIKADHHLCQGPARQVGIDSIPNADYIMFIDQDDYLYKNAIKQLLHSIETTQANIVFSTYIKESKDDEETVNQQHSDVLTQLHGKLFRKKYLDDHKIRFYDDMKYSEDSAFNLMAFNETDKKMYLNEVTYYWNYNENSQSRYKEMEYFTNMYTDYILGQLRGLIHIDKYADIDLDKNLLTFIILYLYTVINIENSKELNKKNPDGYMKYRKELEEFGKLDFVKEILNSKEAQDFFAQNVHGGNLFVGEPIFFKIPFDQWINGWLEDSEY